MSLLQRAIFLDVDSIHPSDLDLSGLEVMVPEWDLRSNTDPEDVAVSIAVADVVVTNKVVIEREHLETADNLKLICAAATGFNNIDIIAARELGIPVCNARAYATASVVQHVFGLLLTLTTRLDAYREDVRSGRWSESEFFCLLDHPIRELEGLKIGIVGYGELGESVARVAQAFGMEVCIAKRDADDDRDGRIALHDLLPEVDVLSLHCPLTEATRGLISSEELGLMKPDAVLINTARGGIVDEAALLEALRAGTIGGAALDVLETEPPAKDHPLITAGLSNLIITPHTAWASRQARQRVLSEIIANIETFKAGETRNQVN